MKAKAMYIGFRNVDLKERTSDQGIKMPAMKGISYNFFQNAWKKGELKEKGLFMNMFVPENELQPELNPGEKYDIEITDLQNRKCKLYEGDEEDE